MSHEQKGKIKKNKINICKASITMILLGELKPSHGSGTWIAAFHALLSKTILWVYSIPSSPFSLPPPMSCSADPHLSLQYFHALLFHFAHALERKILTNLEIIGLPPDITKGKPQRICNCK
jgi:hypothetical protein